MLTTGEFVNAHVLTQVQQRRLHNVHFRVVHYLPTSRPYNALGVEEEKRVGTHLIACAIELAHVQMHASYREVHSPREVAM